MLISDKENKKEKEKYGEESTKMNSQKYEIKLKDRLLSHYISDKTIKIMPTFFSENYFEKKCKEILKFEKGDIEKKVEKFWDPFPFLKIRRWIHRISS